MLTDRRGPWTRQRSPLRRQAGLISCALQSRPYNPHGLALTPGTRLGVYEVTAQIGEGGLGQAYRATDTRLKRQVAIKVLPTSVAQSANDALSLSLMGLPL